MIRNRKWISFLFAVLFVFQIGIGSMAPAKTSAASNGPVILSKSPSPGAANVLPNAPLVITFDENVARGASPAAITIRRLSDNTLFDSYTVASDSRISIGSGSKNVVTITPSKSFDLNTSYYVSIDPGAFVNESNGAGFAGISSTAAWNFTTVASSDTAAPNVVATTPANGGTAGIGTTLSMVFNEPVYAVTGNITITNVNQPSDTQTIGIVSSSVTGSGSVDKTIVIRPTASLKGNSTYEVTMPGAAFQDGAGNSFAGIGSGQWRFTTSAPPLGQPVLQPADNSPAVGLNASFVLTFPVNVAAGTGSIRINKIADNGNVQTIDVKSSSVVFSGSTVTITAGSSALAPNTGYYILIDPGAIVSAADPSAAYEGITDGTAWNFTTGAGNDTSPPTLADRKPNGPQSSNTLSLEMTFNEPVYQGSGNIVVKTAAGGSVVASIPVTSSKVSGGGTAKITVTDTGTVLANNTAYYVEIGSQAFRDGSGNNYAGISGSGGWTFTVTQDFVKPSVILLTPADNAQDIGIAGLKLEALFSEDILLAKPDGVKIKRITGTTNPTFDTTLAVDPQNRRKLIVTAAGTLDPNTDYYVEIAEGAVTDIAGNRFDGILNQYQWTFKTANSTAGPPALSKAEVLGGSKIALTYNELLDASSLPANANFYVTVNGAGRPVTEVQVSGQTVTLTLQSGVSAGQVVKISYSVGTNPIKDSTGTQAAGFANRDVTNTPDSTAPFVVNGTVSGSAITLNYNEQLQSVNPNAYGQFSVYINGSYRSVTQATGSGSVVLLTFSGGAVASGDTVTLSYSASSYPLKDLAGNSAASFSGFYIQNGLDTRAPVLQSVSAVNSVVTLVFDEPLNPALIPPASAFAVVVNGSVRPVTSVSLLGSQVAMLLSSPVSSTDNVVLSYTPGTPAISDNSGNAAAAFSGRQVNGSGSSTPVSLNGIIAKGSAVTLTFQSTLNAAYTPYSSQFSVKVNNVSRPVSSVTVSGANVILLTLYTPVGIGDAVKVGYSSSGIAIRSIAGTEASSFNDMTAANQTTWADNASGDYEAADGGLGIKPSAALTAPDVSPMGQSANRYQITAEKLAAAYNTVRTVSGMEPKVVFTVPGTEKAGLVSVSLSALQDALKAAPDAAFEVIYKDAGYELPISALDFAQLAQMMNAGGPVGQLLISIDTNASSGASQLTTALNGTMAQMAVSPVSFELAVTNNGITKPVDNLRQYVTRTISTAANLTPRQTAVVWLDPQTGKLSYVPTHLESANGMTVVTFKRKGNSTYAVVKGMINYTDIGKHWARNDILLLANKFIVEGRSFTKFEPEQAVTRAEFAAFIARGLGLTGETKAAQRFKDVNSAASNAAYIGAAANAGIVQGMADGTFGPNKPITREEMATMMVRAATAAGVNMKPSQSASTILKRFKDAGRIAAWAQQNAANAVDAGIINGTTSTTFDGKANATRAQAAVMVKRLLVYLKFMDE